MKLKAVLNTDSVNKYNQVFPATVLMKMLHEKHKLGLPANLGHDLEKPIGWSKPLCLYFQPQFRALIGVMNIAETEEEFEYVKKLRMAYVVNEHEAACAPYKDGLASLLGNHLSDESALIFEGCAAFWDNELAVRVCPGLFELQDQDGLIPVNSLKYIGNGIFEYNGIALFAHPYFRRSKSRLNPINDHFFQKVLSLVKANVEVRIAFDSDLAGLPDSFVPSFELQYWWGPKFSDDLVTIPTGVTQHKSTEFEQLFSGIDLTEFRWQSRKGDHIMEIEELLKADTPSRDESFDCRYVHSIVDETTGRTVHTDGAIRSYNIEQYAARRGVDLAHAPKNTDYTKVWRIDQSLPVSHWKEIITHYFRDNHLIGEYFGAEPAESDIFPSTRKDSIKEASLLQTYVPTGINQEDGIRVSLSFRGHSPHNGAARALVPYDILTFDNKRIEVVELLALEIAKILKKTDNEIHIPKASKCIAVEDLYLNLPLVSHASSDDNSVEETVSAITKIIEWSVGHSHDRVISVNLSYPLDDCVTDLVISIYGHCIELLRFMNQHGRHLPKSYSALERWVDDVVKWTSSYKSFERPVAYDVVQLSGLLWKDRKPVPDKYEVKFNYSETQQALVYEIKIPKDEKELSEALLSKTLSIVPCFLIESVRCSSCNKSYLECDCSVVLDGAIHIMEQFELCYGTLTDRAA
jgi:hypothetical protein